MNIEKLESIWHDITGIGPDNVIGLYNWETILRIKNTLREILDEAHEPAEEAAEELLPFDYETAKREPERVVSSIDGMQIVKLFFFGCDITKHAVAITYNQYGQYSSCLFDEQGRYATDNHYFLKLKPKPKHLTKVWVTRIDYKRPESNKAFSETGWLSEVHARDDLSGLQQLFAHTKTKLSLQEREIEV